MAEQSTKKTQTGIEPDMFSALQKLWSWAVPKKEPRPVKRQVAALCTREYHGDLQVLLITTRGSGRWIIPKGWPIPGKNDPQSALTEAWEEAGVQDAEAGTEPVGQYHYVKRANRVHDGPPEPLETNVFHVRVGKLADDYPEAGERQRRWVTASEAADLVAEPQLQAMLRSL